MFTQQFNSPVFSKSNREIFSVRKKKKKKERNPKDQQFERQKIFTLLIAIYFNKNKRSIQ